MLGRTANGLFWMFRYLERADNIARLIEAGFRMAMTRDTIDAEDEWRSVLITAGLQQAYEEHHDAYPGSQVFNFMLRDRDNPGSVLAIIDRARTNARMVRTALTREVWEATNESWMRWTAMLSRPVRDTGLPAVLECIHRDSLLLRGAMLGTMLRNEIFNFTRLGMFVERAENTARILDVKYYVLLPSVSHVGSSLDNVQWDNVLRSVAAERAFRWLNAGRTHPRKIAEFLICDARFPRSLTYCYDKLHSNLEEIGRTHGEEVASHALIQSSRAELGRQSIEGIIDSGLHQFIEGFIMRNQALAAQIERDFRFME